LPGFKPKTNRHKAKAAGQPKAGFASAKCGKVLQKVDFYFLPFLILILIFIRFPQTESCLAEVDSRKTNDEQILA
jgi:hypothetical protein